jgi:hypothetical protein
VKSWTRSRSSTSSSSVGGVKPAGCLVDTLRANPWASAGMAVRRNERVDVRNRNGRVSEAIVRVEHNEYELGNASEGYVRVKSLLRLRRAIESKERQSSARRNRLVTVYTNMGLNHFYLTIDAELWLRIQLLIETSYYALFMYSYLPVYSHILCGLISCHCCSITGVDAESRVDAAIIATPHNLGNWSCAFLPFPSTTYFVPRDDMICSSHSRL